MHALASLAELVAVRVGQVLEDGHEIRWRSLADVLEDDTDPVLAVNVGRSHGVGKAEAKDLAHHDVDGLQARHEADVLDDRLALLAVTGELVQGRVVLLVDNRSGRLAQLLVRHGGLQNRANRAPTRAVVHGHTLSEGEQHEGLEHGAEACLILLDIQGLKKQFWCVNHDTLV